MKTVNTDPAPTGQTCDRCSEPATVAQWWYRGNSDDRHGPIVTLRCDKHQVKS
jgi:hypothetical protein